MQEVFSMNRTGNRMMDKRIDNKISRKRIWITGILFVAMLILFSVCFITKTVTAQKYSERIKQVRSIEVKKGDTLWSIASDYITDEYDDLFDYIEEIKSSNGMSSDEIHYGKYIIVPYYADASGSAISLQ